MFRISVAAGLLAGTALLGGVAAVAQDTAIRATVSPGRLRPLPRPTTTPTPTPTPAPSPGYNGSPIASDSRNGRAIRVVYGNSDQPVTIQASPQVNFACQPKGDLSTTCFAYVVPGSVVQLRVLRGDVPASGGQWAAYDCQGTAGDTCTLTMTQTRTAFVNWSLGTDAGKP